MDFAQKGSGCAWATGDFARGRRDRNAWLGEIGLCHDLGDAVRIGIGAGIDGTDQDLAMKGRVKGDGYHLVGEIDARLPGTPLLFSLTGYYADWNVATARAYRNGAATDLSRGRTDARAWAVRGRIDWRDMVRLGGVGLSPYAAYTHGRVTMDGYTETGGGFPVRLNRAQAGFDEIRVGTVAAAPLADRVMLKASGEWVHRLDQDRGAITGTIIGAGGFALASPAARADWGRVGLDLDLGLGGSALLTLSSHAKLGDGEDAQLSGSIGLRIGF